MPPPQSDQVLALARSKGAFRARELEPLGIPRSVLGRLVARGDLVRIGRGLYAGPDSEVSRHHTLVIVATCVSGCVVNLLSALTFHELTDELPPAVWIAIRRGIDFCWMVNSLPGYLRNFWLFPAMTMVTSPLTFLPSYSSINSDRKL